MMNGAQLHLMLNHLPVMGSLFTLGLLMWGLLRKNHEIQKVAMGAMVLVAITAWMAFLTGEPAEEVAEGFPNFEEAWVEPHEHFAEYALYASQVLGLLALTGLILTRGRPVPLGLAGLVLLANLGVAGVMGYTAHLGGMIRHPEIRHGASPPVGETHRGEAEAHEED